MKDNYFKEEKRIDNKIRIETRRVPMSTTLAIKELLSRELKRNTLCLMEQSLQGQVILEPILTIEHDLKMSLSFKVGMSNGKMYVLKNIVEFQKAVEEEAYYTYGKKFGFTHTLEAFREEDRPLVKLICDWVQEYRRFIGQRYYYTNSIPYYSTKYITLNPRWLERFILLIGERPFMGDIDEKGERLWQRAQKELTRELIIKGEREGIKVKVKVSFGVSCSNYDIYFERGKIYLSSKEQTAPIQNFLRCMEKEPDHSVCIAEQDVPAFCRDLLPKLESFYVCHKEKFEPEAYGVVPVRFEIYLDAPQKDRITCKAEAIYGDKRYNVFKSSDDALRRDSVKEMAASKLISHYLTTFDTKENLGIIKDEANIYELLTVGIQRMKALGEIFISDQLKRFTIKPAPKVSVGVSVLGSLLELSLTSTELGHEELMEMLSKYRRKQKFFRLKDGSFISFEGEEIGVLGEIKQNLHLPENHFIEGKAQVPKYRALYLDTQLKEHPGIKVAKNKAFKELIRNMKTVEDNDFEIPAALEDILREYQKRGFLWLKTLKHNGFGGILADDMGLGKTLQVIAFLLSEQSEQMEASDLEKEMKTLIVCPASLVFNWKAEIERFAPSLCVKLATGTLKEREKVISSLENGDIVITSYDLLKRDIKYYEALSFGYEVIDEAQYIKNINTQVTKAVKAVHADFKIALTGTPIENRLSELWSIFDYLMPGFLYNYARFKEELEQPITQEKDEYATLRLQKMIHPFVLRRLKKEVLTDLPDKLEENRYAVLTGEQQKLYDANVHKLKMLINDQSEKDFKQSKIQILAELTKLREICCDPSLVYDDYKSGSAKLDMCIEMIQNAINGGHKILLFSQFTTMLEIIEQRLKKEGISYYLLNGATPKEKRMNMVEQFNKDDTSVFCISLKAGGTGLNLTAADIVIHYDPWWNVAVQDQATDRAHRIGQENVVNVYKLIAKGTIEENIVKLQDLKKELADQVLNGEGMNTGSFTKEELIELLM